MKIDTLKQKDNIGNRDDNPTLNNSNSESDDQYNKPVIDISHLIVSNNNDKNNINDDSIEDLLNKEKSKRINCINEKELVDKIDNADLDSIQMVIAKENAHQLLEKQKENHINKENIKHLLKK